MLVEWCQKLVGSVCQGLQSHIHEETIHARQRQQVKNTISHFRQRSPALSLWLPSCETVGESFDLSQHWWAQVSSGIITITQGFVRIKWCHAKSIQHNEETLWQSLSDITASWAGKFLPAAQSTHAGGQRWGHVAILTPRAVLCVSSFSPSCPWPSGVTLTSIRVPLSLTFHSIWFDFYSLPCFLLTYDTWLFFCFVFFEGIHPSCAVYVICWCNSKRGTLFAYF